MILSDEKLLEMGRNIKAVVCDLDATLLGPDKLISKGNMEAIREAQKKGILVSICSGRISTQLKAYIKEMKIEGPVITTNGGLLLDGKTGDRIWGQPIEQSDVVSICDYCMKIGVHFCAFTEEDSYFTHDNPRIKNFELYNSIASKSGMEPVKLIEIDSSAEIKGSSYKVLLFDTDPDRLNLAREYISTLSGIHFTIAEARTIDIMHKGVNKGDGVRRLCAAMGITTEQVAAFGDFDNDIDMMRAAGMPIAMGNACDLLKEYCVYVTDDFREDGVGKAIRRFML